MARLDTFRSRLFEAASGKRTGDAEQQQIGVMSFDTNIRLLI